MANEPSIDASLDNSTLAKGVDNGSLGQILAQLKIITIILREGLDVNIRDEDITFLELNTPVGNNTPF